MKTKKFTSFILSLIFIAVLCASSVFAAGQKVFDYAGVFTEEQILSLEEIAADYAEKYNMDLAVLIIDDAEGKDTLTYAEDFYDENGLGIGENYSGAIYIIDFDNRILNMVTTGDAIYYLTDERINVILDNAYNYAADGDYYGSAESFLETCASYYESGIPGNQYTYNEETGEIVRHKSITPFEACVSVIISSAAAIAFFLITRSEYKFKKPQKNEASRVATNFTAGIKNDNFINKSVVTRIIPKSQPPRGGGSGGGSLPGRSTIHTGSSGRMHGGGGGGRSF